MSLENKKGGQLTKGKRRQVGGSCEGIKSYRGKHRGKKGKQRNEKVLNKWGEDIRFDVSQRIDTGNHGTRGEGRNLHQQFIPCRE